LGASDDWNITQDARKGENGAGYLYKRGKGAALWTKRFFVVTDSKLVYYVESDRGQMKGEIVLAGATASVSSTRSDGRKKFFFQIHHPICGTRELYAKTSGRRTQWISKINEMSAMLLKASNMNGVLSKLGGSLVNAWQERWVIIAGTTLDYFEAAQDNQSKGSLTLVGCKVRTYTTKDRPHVFEVTARIFENGKKREKKISFSTKDEETLKQWVTVIKSVGKIDEEGGGADSPNPLLSTSASGKFSSSVAQQHQQQEAPSPSFATDASAVFNDEFSPSSKHSGDRPPAEKKGYLSKKSPNLLGLYQRRFFVLADSELLYFKCEDDYNNKRKPKGEISCKEIPIPKGLELYNKDEVLLKAHGRIYQLKATNYVEASAWLEAITEWCAFTKKSKAL